MICLSRPHIPSNFLKAVFHKFYLVHFWILCPIYIRKYYQICYSEKIEFHIVETAIHIQRFRLKWVLLEKRIGSILVFFYFLLIFRIFGTNFFLLTPFAFFSLRVSYLRKSNVLLKMLSWIVFIWAKFFLTTIISRKALFY